MPFLRSRDVFIFITADRDQSLVNQIDLFQSQNLPFFEPRENLVIL